RGHVVFGLSIAVSRGKAVFIADTSVHETPTSEQLAGIARQAAALARQMGNDPRVAFLSFSNFGGRLMERTERIREAIRHLDRLEVDFEYDGEMQADVAMDHE